MTLFFSILDVLSIFEGFDHITSDRTFEMEKFTLLSNRYHAILVKTIRFWVIKDPKDPKAQKPKAHW